MTSAAEGVREVSMEQWFGDTDADGNLTRALSLGRVLETGSVCLRRDG